MLFIPYDVDCFAVLAHLTCICLMSVILADVFAGQSRDIKNASLICTCIVKHRGVVRSVTRTLVL